MIFKVPFVCGARNLGEALRRIAEGAAMIRTKGEAGSGNIVEAVRHMRTIVAEMRRLTTLRHDELGRAAKDLAAPLDLVREVARAGKLPVPNFSAGGIATPADAALVRHLGAEAIFVGSGIFKSEDPEKRARAIVKAATHFEDAQSCSRSLRGVGRGDEGSRRAPTRSQGASANPRLVARDRRHRSFRLLIPGLHAYRNSCCAG